MVLVFPGLAESGSFHSASTLLCCKNLVLVPQIFLFSHQYFCLRFYWWVPITHQESLYENPVFKITVIFTVGTLWNVQIQDFDKSICYDWRCTLWSVSKTWSNRVNGIRAPEKRGELFTHFKAQKPHKKQPTDQTN